MEYQEVIKQGKALMKDLKDGLRTPENAPEPDSNRANWLFGLLSGFRHVFLASANMSGLNIPGKLKIFDVAQGKVIERRN